MSRRYSKPTSRLLLVLALMLAATAPAFASKKDDDYKKAQAAANGGNSAEAARLFCALRDEDEKFKDVAQQCNIWMDVMKKLRKQDEQRMAEGEQAFKERRYDDAEQKFKNVKVADLADKAKDYLNRIAIARMEAEAGAASDKKFQDAVAAFNTNEFNTARSLFGAINGPRAAEAQSYVQKINRYDRAIQEARRQGDAKNYRDAITAYQEAMSIKADGPGDPRGGIAQMNQLMAAAANPPKTTTPTPNPPSQTTVATTTVPAPVPAPPTPHGTSPATNPAKSAVVMTTAPTRDVETLVREAAAAEAKGDIGVAKGKYLAALAAEPNNARVRAALAALPKAEEGSTQSAGKEADVMLARAISEFYTGDYEASDVHIGDYLSANGSKTGLAYFFRGAGKLSRYYLNGATSDKKLMVDARAAFQKAKQSSGFHPPDQNFISPKVLDFYQSAQ